MSHKYTTEIGFVRLLRAWPGFRREAATMTRRSGLAGLFLLALSVGLADCGSSTATAPTAVATVVADTFTGTINPQGTDSHNFTVNYAAATTNASITVVSLVTVANQTPQAITIGVAFGTLNLGVCNAAISNPAAPIGTELPTTNAPFQNGTYCVMVFDNTAAPTVTEPLTYNITVKHY
jgi:hypothetical protein